MTLRRVRTFRVPGDPVVANELAQQLAKFEENVTQETSDIRDGYQPAHKVMATEAQPGKEPMLAPGQAAGFVTSVADCNVLLDAPSAKYAGRSVVIYKRSAANFVNLRVQNGKFITGVATYSIGNAGKYEIFCDGVEYWL